MQSTPAAFRDHVYASAGMRWTFWAATTEGTWEGTWETYQLFEMPTEEGQ